MGLKESYTIQQGQMQGLPDTAARWALRGSEDPGRSGPWKQCWPTVITTVQPVGQMKWLYPTTQLSWDQDLGTASGFRSPNTRKTLLNLREFYEDHKVWWNWSMGRSLASWYLNKNSQEIGIFCSRTEIIQTSYSAVIVMAEVWQAIHSEAPIKLFPAAQILR